MLTTSVDFEESIKYLTAEEPVYIGDIGEKMSSLEFNLAFGAIEANLNELYEKTRVLTDVQNYCREYILHQIQTARADLANKLRLIENSSDCYVNTDYVAYCVPFKNADLKISDRDGAILPQGKIIQNCLYPAACQLESAVLTSVAKKQSTVNYRDNLQELLSGQAYKSFYLTQLPVAEGVSEEITVVFDKAVEINQLLLSLINCELTALSYINTDDEIVGVPLAAGIYIGCHTAKGIVFTITCSSYEKQSVPVGLTATAYDYWNYMKTDKFSRSTQQESMQPLSAQFNQFLYEQNSEQFFSEVMHWQNANEDIAKKNILTAKRKL